MQIVAQIVIWLELLDPPPEYESQGRVDHVQEGNRVTDVFVALYFVGLVRVSDLELVVVEVLGVHEVDDVEGGEEGDVDLDPLEAVAHGEVDDVDGLVGAVDAVGALVEEGVEVPD